MDNGQKQEPAKNVDESWKEAVVKDKERCACGGGHEHGDERGIEASFPLFISGLMMEGIISLGEVEHPIAKKKETNLPHAKFIIDTLAMLQEKTKNNLAKEEAEMLDGVLYELRMRFVAKSGGEKK